MRQAGEPSVEEILESIKKVIARDNRADAAEERKLRESAGMAVRQDSGDGEAEDEEILDLAADAELTEDFASVDEHGEDEESADAPLVTEDARMSMQDSLTAEINSLVIPPELFADSFSMEPSAYRISIPASMVRNTPITLVVSFTFDTMPSLSLMNVKRLF